MKSSSRPTLPVHSSCSNFCIQHCLQCQSSFSASWKHTPEFTTMPRISKKSECRSRDDLYSARVAARRQNISPSPSVAPIWSRNQPFLDSAVTYSCNNTCDRHTYSAHADCEKGDVHSTRSPAVETRRDSGYHLGGHRTNKKFDDEAIYAHNIRRDASLRRAVIIWSCVGSFLTMVIIGFVLGTLVA